MRVFNQYSSAVPLPNAGRGPALSNYYLCYIFLPCNPDSYVSLTPCIIDCCLMSSVYLLPYPNKHNLEIYLSYIIKYREAKLLYNWGYHTSAHTPVIPNPRGYSGANSHNNRLNYFLLKNLNFKQLMIYLSHPIESNRQSPVYLFWYILLYILAEIRTHCSRVHTIHWYSGT